MATLAPPKQHLAAACVDASDDLLLCVFAPLSLVERLRLATVSKRWLRLLLAHLRIPREHAWRAVSVVQRAGDSLRSLSLESLAETPDWESTLAGILRALPAGGGTNLSTCVIWEPTDTVLVDDIPFLSPGQAKQLRASCPRLDASTRLAFCAKHPAQALALLDALPGRHAVRLLPATAKPAPALQEQLSLLLRHPRLCALQIGEISDTLSSSRPTARAAAFVDAALAAVAEAVQRGGDGRCSLEHLCVVDGKGRPPQTGPALLGAAAAAGAFRAAPDAPGAGQQCSLRSLRLVGAHLRRDFVRSVLAASAGSLRHLSTNVDKAFFEPDGEDGGAGGAGGAAELEAVSALVELMGKLESLSVADWAAGLWAADHDSHDDDAPVLPWLTPLIASPDCRVRCLALAGGYVDSEPDDDYEADFPDGGCPAIPDQGSFLHALSENSSLHKLKIEGYGFTFHTTAMLAYGLAARSAPLLSLDLSLSMLTNDDGAPPSPPARPASPCGSLLSTAHTAVTISRLRSSLSQGAWLGSSRRRACGAPLVPPFRALPVRHSFKRD